MKPSPVPDARNRYKSSWEINYTASVEPEPSQAGLGVSMCHRICVRGTQRARGGNILVAVLLQLVVPQCVVLALIMVTWFRKCNKIYTGWMYYRFRVVLEWITSSTPGRERSQVKVVGDRILKHSDLMPFLPGNGRQATLTESQSVCRSVCRSLEADSTMWFVRDARFCNQIESGTITIWQAGLGRDGYDI